MNEEWNEEPVEETNGEWDVWYVNSVGLPMPFYTDSYCTQLYPKTAPIWKAIQTSRGNIQNGTTQHIQNGARPPPPHEINPTNTSTASYAQAHARARAHALGHAIGNNSITQANSNTATSKTNENCSSQTTNKKIKKEDDDDVRPKNFHENLYLNELRIMGFTNVREALGGIRYAMGYVSVGGPVAEAAMIWIVGQREAAAEARDLDLARISSEISREEELIAQNRDRRLKENITLANASTELILMPSYSTGQSKDGSSRNKGNVFFSFIHCFENRNITLLPH